MRMVGAILGGAVAAACLAGLARAAEMDAAEVHRGSAAAYDCAHAHLAKLSECFQGVINDETSKKTINDSFVLGLDVAEFLVVGAIADTVPNLTSQDKAVLMETQGPLYLHILRIETDLGVAQADACRATITNLDMCLHMKPPAY